MAIFCPLTYANSIEVNQDKLKLSFSCDDETKTVCFSGAKFYPEYNIYIFNFTAEVKDFNLKGLTIEDYISASMGPLLGMINPKAANFYNIKPIMRELIDESSYSVDNAVLGLIVNYKSETYVGIKWVEIKQVTMLSEKIKKSNIKPEVLLIERCEKIKSIITNLKNDKMDEFCNYGD